MIHTIYAEAKLRQKLISLITQGGYVFTGVCLSVSLLAGLPKTTRPLSQNLEERCGCRKKRLNQAPSVLSLSLSLGFL